MKLPQLLISELISEIISSPTLIKLPIIIKERKIVIVIGFSEIEISCFPSKDYRRIHLLSIGCHQEPKKIKQFIVLDMFLKTLKF